MKRSVALACAVLVGMLVFGPAATSDEGFWPSDAELIAAFLAFVLLVSTALALVVGAVSSLVRSRTDRRERHARHTEDRTYR